MKNILVLLTLMGMPCAASAAADANPTSETASPIIELKKKLPEIRAAFNRRYHSLQKLYETLSQARAEAESKVHSLEELTKDLTPEEKDKVTSWISLLISHHEHLKGLMEKMENTNNALSAVERDPSKETALHYNTLFSECVAVMRSLDSEMTHIQHEQTNILKLLKKIGFSFAFTAPAA